MKKSATKPRIRNIAMINGEEPILSVDPSAVDLIKAYNWYSANCDNDDAVKYVIAYLKSKKISRNQIKKVSRIEPYRLKNIGWNCRILSNGGVLPDDIHNACFEKLAKLIDEVANEPVESTPVVSVQERVRDKTSDLISTLEIEIDRFVVNEKNDFDVGAWFQKHGVKPAIAKKIADFYQPLYSQVYDAVQGKDSDLKYAYRNWKKPALKKYLEFIKSIISTAETNTITTKTTRKPRKKKEKPATQLVAKMKYKEKDDDFKITSIQPATIIGANQLWVFNTKTRALSVYNAIGPAGLQVKGTTMTGFDEKTSITKVVRKPEITLNELADAGKINLRKLMDTITTKPKNANGRINSDMVLMRVVK